MQFLNKTYTRESLKLAVPVMLTQLGQVSVNLFDNMIVGKMLGADALAAVSLGNGAFFVAFMFALGFSYAIPPLVSKAHSQQNHSRISSVLRHGFVVNLAVGILMMFLLLGGMPLLYFMDQPEKILPDTIAFLTIMAFSMIPFVIFQTYRELAEGLSFTIGVTKATIAANILNIVLNYILIGGKLGFPEMGVRGSAIATLVARVFMFVFLYVILYRDPRTSRYIKGFHLKVSTFSKVMFRKILQLGFPTSMQMVFEVSAFAGAAFICGMVSAEDVAGHQIAISMASFTYNLCVGFGVASTVMIGKKLGKREFVEIRKIGINNLKISFSFMLTCGLLFIAMRNYIPHLFVQKEDVAVLELASQLLIIAAFFQFSDGILVVSVGSLRGIQDVKVPSLITFVAYWIITLPLGYYLAYIRGMGAIGMWIALGLGLALSAIFLIYRFLNLSDRKIKVALQMAKLQRDKTS